MQIISKTLTHTELQKIAQQTFGNLIKAVVDLEKEIVAIDAELHADLEAYLIKNGSEQKNLWGINLYPEIHDKNFIEFDSLINIKPFQNNRSRGVDDPAIREKIRTIINKVVSL